MNTRMLLVRRALLLIGVIMAMLVTPLAGFGAATALADTEVTAQGSPEVYVVHRGDTLAAIARRFGVTADAICRLNALRNCNRIYPGQVLLLPGSEPAGKATRVRFALGATSATVPGHVAAGGTETFLVAAQRGQTMMVALDSLRGGLHLTIWGRQDGQVLVEDAPNSWSGRLPATQDYVLQVSGGSRPVDYALQITIPRDIVFRPGTYGTTFTGSVAAGSFTRHLLRARGGQTMDISITSPNDDVFLTISGADDGQVLARAEAGAMHWRGRLPLTQAYVIDAVATDGASTFTISVTVR